MCEAGMNSLYHLKYFIWFSLGVLLLSNNLCFLSSARRLFQSHDGGGGRCSGRIPELLPDRTGHYEEAAVLRGVLTRKNTVDHQVETFVIGEMRQTLHTTCRFKNVVLTWWKRLMQSWDVEAKALFSVMLDFVTITIKLIFFLLLLSNLNKMFESSDAPTVKKDSVLDK